VTVAGAGALGLCIALELARRGAGVTLCDPAPVGDNASGVAAGMLAPVFETVLDPDGRADLDFLRAPATSGRGSRMFPSTAPARSIAAIRVRRSARGSTPWAPTGGRRPTDLFRQRTGGWTRAR